MAKKISADASDESLKTKATEAQETVVIEPVNAEPAKPAFPFSVLRNKCFQLFGVTSSTFDGATSGLSQLRQYTIGEVAETINNWLKKEVH